ncbi:cohesin subunit SA-1 isoform X2 [Sitodiplosis mosellana]|uniref:cohesin subunit SA-1 isoform X2 n=1 Tax=Sitodiplosis mosellana TaxID=263140 RepID=UPI002444AF63|nr:cohesin subunit SA-1 isoform X2 [Sitodiplosis mosellana]
MMMPRRGGKRIRMDDPVPMEYEEDMYRGGAGSDHLNESYSDRDDGESPVKGGRMTRLRARGGIRDRPPIIDDDDDEIYHAPPPTQSARKRKAGAGRKPVAEKIVERVEKPVVEKPPVVHHHRGDDRERDVTEDENSLYYIIRNSKSAIASIVDEWIESYKQDRDHALMVLMQFFINASGCKGRITPEISFMEHTVIIRKMTEEFDEESGEYPLIMPGQQWKKFKVNFCDFVQTLVKQCQYSIIFDQFLMDHLISLLTGLSDSQVRAFRHTATLAAMKLMTALVDVALLVSVNFDNAARQYESERLKTRDKRANDRLESLLTKRTELEENMEEIKNMLTYMFKSVFVHRYRDTLPEIRGICMSEIGVWMIKFPVNFLDDSYLKYIGWTLHDKVGDVRLRCLQALLPLYASEDLKGKLELFTSKFKDRIVAMTLDKEFEVAVIAVKLVISILKIHPDILTDKDCEIVYELVYSSHRGVAQAAAEFLNVRLFHLDEDSMDVVKTKRGKKRLPNTPLIRDLVQFFIESELHEHGAYLVDSFIDNNPMVKDWECMTDLLIEEPGPNEEQLDNKQESTLIEIMVSAVRQCSTGEPPVGRGTSRKMTQTSKEVKQVQEDKQKMTEHFIQTLPTLLQRYGADAEKLANLMAIPQYFELVVYTNSRQEANLQAFLDKMGSIMLMHNDRDVLETCSKTLEFLCTEGSGIFTKCDIARSNIIDQCVNRYKEAIDDWRNLIAGEEIPNEDEIFNIIVSLKKVSILYSCHNLNPWGIFDSLYEDLDECQSRTAEGKALPNEALVYCIESCYFAITWGLHYLENTCEPQNQEDASVILQRNLFKFMNVCTELVRSSKVIEIQEAAFKSICDLLIIFSDVLGTINPVYKKLHYVSTAEQQAVLNGFVQQYVFATQEEESHDETRIEELHKKRNYLAAYCKLVVYNVIPIKSAADIFKHYLRCYNEYGDIIKATMGKAREINKINCALTMCLSLITTYKDIQKANDSIYVSKSSQPFTDLKELAKRFALSFGLDAVKNREAIISLHRAGILFAVQNNNDAIDDPSAPPPCLLFLEILNEFTNKLLKQDKKVVLNFLDRRISSGIPSSRVEDWQPLLNYRNSLMHGETDQVPVTSKRAYTKRRKEQDANEEDDEENENSDVDPDLRG